MGIFRIYDTSHYPDRLGLDPQREQVSLRGCDGTRHVEQLAWLEWELDQDGNVKDERTEVEGYEELGPCDGSCGHLGSFTWPPEAPRESPA